MTGLCLFLFVCCLLCQTRCDEVADALVAQGLHAVALHGGRNQSEREAALNNFRKGTTNILVSVHTLFLISCMFIYLSIIPWAYSLYFI